MNSSGPPIVNLLELAALNYIEVRDHPRDLNQREAVLKRELLELMKEYGREVYEYNGIEIRVNVNGEEAVDVKIHPAKRREENAGPAWVSPKVST